MATTSYRYHELPIAWLQPDRTRPNSDLGTQGEDAWPKKSIEVLGILEPIVVSELGDTKYTIIDGRRRYNAAQELGPETVPCTVYPKLKPADLEIIRFEVQHNRLPWTRRERSDFLNRLESLLTS